MFLLGWPLWWILLTLRMSACGLEISQYDSHEVICSQGLSECTMKDEIPLNSQNTVDVQALNPDFKLCCKNKTTCTLCLVIDIEFSIRPDEEDQGSSGSAEEDYNEEKTNSKGSLIVCYGTAASIPPCKKVEFTVNHIALTQQNRTKISVVIADPDDFPFDSRLIVGTKNLIQDVITPSFNKVCSQQLQKIVPKCRVLKFRIVVIPEKNEAVLQFEGRSKTLPSMCVQNEKNGRCQSWNRSTIPLYSVTPCTCVQVWEKDDQISTRSQQCPFNETGLWIGSEKNVWENITVSGPREQQTNYGAILSWNVSAPCRLDGEVWPLYEGRLSGRISKQPLARGIGWKQNSAGLWVKTFVFDNIHPGSLPCLMMRVNGMEHDLGPFRFNTAGRWRWSLLAVVAVLLACMSVLMFCVFHKSVKNWVWSWQHGGIVKIGRRRHVVLLSPPDVDDGISELVCQLGSFLSNKGFSVSVDQWSRKEQSTWGPLPWLHSQLLKLNSLGGRVLLVLTRKALERTEEWMHWNKDIINEGMGKEEKDVPKICSPYSDLFIASLFLIHADKLLGRAGERFLLIKFDSHSTETQTSNRSLPELLQGLPLFRLPTQTQSLLAELTVTETGRGSRGMTWAR